ncbi:hypothetical protein M501DRAFT_1017212 [Patellaria atrata CBS 101060]|uniref:PARP catalytic domain-containing protein n=1 Tax=Patellaria atrata CBS 101060 TaxID=1346257 RepID=A0A9P4SAI7_9PEZI|nr:hypothetical protein M501DRAFT_1017212 [Patellaria atrata CBS 101060]
MLSAAKSMGLLPDMKKRGLFSRKTSSNVWHKKVEMATNCHKPILNVDLAKNPEFPWTTVQEITETYLSRKKETSSSEKRDAKLLKLMLKHGNREVALAACAHLVSPETLLTFIKGNIHMSPYQAPAYVRLIAVASYTNPLAVDQMELSRARSLNKVLSAPSLWDILPLLETEVVASSLLHPQIVFYVQRIFSTFALELETLVSKGQWYDVHNINSNWLRIVYQNQINNYASTLRADVLLNIALPSWKKYSEWKPNVQRLHNWTKFSADQRALFKDVLALEGPDILEGVQPTLRAALVARQQRSNQPGLRHGGLYLELSSGAQTGLEKLSERLCKFMDDVSTQSKYSMALLGHYLKNGFDLNAITLLEGVLKIGDNWITARVVEFIKSTNRESNQDIERTIRVVLALGHPKARDLQQPMSPQIIPIVSGHMERLERELMPGIMAQYAVEEAERNLYAFGCRVRLVAWMIPLLDESWQVLFRNWPLAETLERTQTLRKDLARMQTDDATRIVGLVNRYCRSKLIRRLPTHPKHTLIIEALLDLWRSTQDTERRSLAVFLAYTSRFAVDACCACIKSLEMPDNNFITQTDRLLGQHDITICLGLASLLAERSNSSSISAWKDFLLHIIDDFKGDLLTYTLEKSGVSTWFQFLDDIDQAFRDTIRLDTEDSLTTILDPALHLWNIELLSYRSILICIEGFDHSKSALYCFLTGFNNPQRGDLVAILELLRINSDAGILPSLVTVVTFLTTNGHNAQVVSEALSAMFFTRQVCLREAIEVIDLYRNYSKIFARLRLFNLLLDTERVSTETHMLEQIGKLLSIQQEDDTELTEEELTAVIADITDQFDAILVEAERLDSLRISCQNLDSSSTSEMLKTLGIKIPSALEDSLGSLRYHSWNVMDQISEHEVDLYFPLTELTPFQRTAMGMGESKSLILRITLNSMNLPTKYCIHSENGSDSSLGSHSQWRVGGYMIPEAPYCEQVKLTRATYQLYRDIWRYLSDGFTSIERIYALVSTKLGSMGSSCMVCGASGVKLFRSTVCTNTTCIQTALRMDIDIRLVDLRNDPAVVDLLVLVEYTVAKLGTLKLLPGLPTKFPANIISTIDSLPPMAYLQRLSSFGLATTLSSHHRNADAALTWLCNTYRGYIVSATGKFRIPNIPHAHQFLLASATPELESAWMANYIEEDKTSRVLFHGTSIDRLYAILCQGLRVCSGTELQRNGAAYGKGVYMAEEPSTSWPYARLSTHSWKNSIFKSVRVLLGCELAGESVPKAGNIHMIEDASRLMVRYIFVMPEETRAPLASHLTTAMMSVFNSLRSGAV